jgi:hypothetical protein
MATTTNPFEPPRTIDLDGDDAPAPGRLVVSTRALQELVDATPWVRRLVRLGMLSIAIQLLTLVGALAHRPAFSVAASVIGSSAMTIAVWALFLIALRRYAAASDLLRARHAGAVGAVIAAQHAYLKLAAVISVIAAGVVLFGIAVGVGSGRYLSWLYR